MMTLNKILIGLLLSLGIVAAILFIRIDYLQKEKDRYQSNTNALLSDIKRMQIDSTTNAADVRALRLSLDEFKRYRGEDAETIKKLNIRLKDVQSVAKHDLKVSAPIAATVKDSVIIRDTVLLKVQTVSMRTPHIEIAGIIENQKLTGSINLPVNLNQIVWVEYKHRFLWWRWGTKTVHQTISTDNPYVKINYSEMIQVGK